MNTLVALLPFSLGIVFGPVHCVSLVSVSRVHLLAVLSLLYWPCTVSSMPQILPASL